MHQPERHKFLEAQVQRMLRLFTLFAQVEPAGQAIQQRRDIGRSLVPECCQYFGYWGGNQMGGSRATVKDRLDRPE